MEKQDEKQSRFLGTYFDSSKVITFAKVAEIASWVVGVVYALDFLLAILIFVLSYLRGFLWIQGPTDWANYIIQVIERPFRGVVYFVALQAISFVLLIFLDVEANLRKTARNTTQKDDMIK